MTEHASDTAFLLDLLRERGAAGIHTSELRRMGASGNPSQRAADCERIYGVTIRRETEWWTDARGKRRNGSRYTLISEPGRGLGSDPELVVQGGQQGDQSAVGTDDGSNAPEPTAALFSLPEAEPRADYRDPDAFEDAA